MNTTTLAPFAHPPYERAKLGRYFISRAIETMMKNVGAKCDIKRFYRLNPRWNLKIDSVVMETGVRVKSLIFQIFWFISRCNHPNFTTQSNSWILIKHWPIIDNECMKILSSGSRKMKKFRCVPTRQIRLCEFVQHFSTNCNIFEYKLKFFGWSKSDPQCFTWLYTKPICTCIFICMILFGSCTFVFLVTVGSQSFVRTNNIEGREFQPRHSLSLCI